MSMKFRAHETFFIRKGWLSKGMKNVINKLVTYDDPHIISKSFGKAIGKHLHFEVRNTKDVRINPIKYIDADLPNNSNKVTSLYQVYDNKKRSCLPNVKVGSSDYAGNKGHNISGVYIDNAIYRVHQKGGKWLPWVTNRNDYAGNLGKSIDAIQIKGKTYRVYDNKKGKWLPWVSSENDFDGNIGNSIGAIQIK